MWYVKPVGELVVDELAAVVAVNAQQGEGKLVPNLLDALLDPAMGAVQEGVFLVPAGTPIGAREGLAAVAGSVRAAGGHPVKLEETGFSFVPIKHDPHRYRVPQEGTGLCQAQAPQPPPVFHRERGCGRWCPGCRRRTGLAGQGYAHIRWSGSPA